MTNRPVAVIQSQRNNRQTNIEIAASRRLEPIRQGSLDSLCGLVSTINAIRLVLADCAPLSKARSKYLFGEGIEFLHRKRGLLAAMVDGMGTRRRFALARHLARHASNPQFNVHIERPNHAHWSSIADMFRWMESSIVQGQPVLLTIEGGLEHHTVVAGMTARTMLLFDSDGHRYLRKSSCGLRSGFNRIPTNGLLRVAVSGRVDR